MPRLEDIKKKILIQREPTMGINKILEFIQKYDNVSLQDFPAMEPSKRDEIQKLLNSQPNVQEQAEWSDILVAKDTYQTDISVAESFLEALDSYIQHWDQSRPVGNHVDDANVLYNTVNQHIQTYYRQIEQNDWDNLDIDSNQALVSYLNKYPHSSHKSEIDDLYWANINKEVMTEVREYLNNPLFSKHQHEAEQILQALFSWGGVKKSTDLYKVFNYIKDNPDSPFIQQAEALLMELKELEIDRMKTSPNSYEVNTLLNLIRVGIFTKNDLIYEGVMTERVYDTITNPDVSTGLPDIQRALDNSKPECKEGYTDVYFFGIPSTGKTCILMGLSCADSLHINLAHGGGDYADALQQYIDAGITVPQTRMGFVATMEATISGRHDDSQHRINLVEMAGEDFAKKIAGNEEHIFDFESMGSGVSNLLRNDNKKVFFIIIDPTTSVIRYRRKEQVGYDEDTGEPIYDLLDIRCNQQNLIDKLVCLFAYPGNAEIMKKVDSIHIIVTKADLLGNDIEREQEALKLFESKYKGKILRPLIDLCKEYNINVQNNYHPKLYTFSLGNFYVGGVYEYDSTDSNKLVEAIRNSTGEVKKKTFKDKVKSIFN